MFSGGTTDILSVGVVWLLLSLVSGGACSQTFVQQINCYEDMPVINCFV